jgi:hypothetical protein
MDIQSHARNTSIKSKEFEEEKKNKNSSYAQLTENLAARILNIVLLVHIQLKP